MRFLINASNLKVGGGLQVADSICQSLNKYKEHDFVLVLSSYLYKTADCVRGYSNVLLFQYNLKHSILKLLTGRDRFLDGLVTEYRPKSVLTIFGPSIWRPKVPHICGFARAQLVLRDSPYYQMIGVKEKIKYKVWKYAFKKSSDVFYTENPFISGLLPKVIGQNIKVYTITNYYNQIYDKPEKWKCTYSLPDFCGITLLSIGNTGRHKNLSICYEVAQIFENKHPELNIRFVLTIDEKRFIKDLRNTYDIDFIHEHFVFLGSIEVEECPYLYQQANIMFMPTLMECFTATYVEAMRMGVPIVTTDLEFARGLCGDAACYYGAVDASDAVNAIFHVYSDEGYAKELIKRGGDQLLKFDNYEQRVNKLIGVLEEISE